jgi:hypothetical protein
MKHRELGHFLHPGESFFFSFGDLRTLEKRDLSLDPYLILEYAFVSHLQ